MTTLFKPTREKIITCSHLEPRILWQNIGDINKPIVVCDNCKCRLPDSDPVAQYWMSRALESEIYAS